MYLGDRFLYMSFCGLRRMKEVTQNLVQHKQLQTIIETMVQTSSQSYCLFFTFKFKKKTPNKQTPKLFESTWQEANNTHRTPPYLFEIDLLVRWNEQRD